MFVLHTLLKTKERIGSPLCVLKSTLNIYDERFNISLFLLSCRDDMAEVNCTPKSYYIL